MVIKAQSPAGFAEEYIIESIWNNRFAPGSILPAERELSELIGVTRTTLREVLQRLARDGWLTIQHGKPTKVNNFWETSGLNILETLARLDHDSVPQLIDNLLSVRTNIASIFIRTAVRQHPDKVQEIGSSRDCGRSRRSFHGFGLWNFPWARLCVWESYLSFDPQRSERLVYPRWALLLLKSRSAQIGVNLLCQAEPAVPRAEL